MAEVNVHEAKTQLSRLLQRVEKGEEIVITRAGQSVARLVPFKANSPRSFGHDRGLFEVPDDFDASLPEEVLELLHGPVDEALIEKYARLLG
jgi:prevent-host-death family protein